MPCGGYPFPVHVLHLRILRELMLASVLLCRKCIILARAAGSFKSCGRHYY